jgi:hypothetical protein
VQTSEQPVRYLTVREILEDYEFLIPDYQRGFAWGTRQVGDFIDDIERAIQSGGSHFTGTIVGNKTREFVLEVIDGQQRLTTTMLLLKSIQDSKSNTAKIGHLIRRGNAGNERLVLKPNREVESFYRRRIIENDDSATPEVASHHSLVDAKALFDEWLMKDEVDASIVLNVLLDKLFFILFLPPSDNEAGLMFEVINNRGKSLSQLEKIKNYLIYFATVNRKHSLRDEVNDAWGRILQRLSVAGWSSSDDEDRFLRNCYLVFFDTTKSKSWDPYGQLKELFPTDTKRPDFATSSLSEFVKFLDGASGAIANLSNGAHAYQAGATPALLVYLRRIRCHPVDASILPLYLSAMCRKGLRPDKRAGLLDLLEKLNFRVYVLPRVTNRADSGQGELFRYAYDFYRKVISPAELAKLLIEFTKKQCGLRNLVEHLTIDQDETEDYYLWPGNRYFLARFEEDLQEKHNNATFDIERVLERRRSTRSGDYLSVEHIWARKNRESDFPMDTLPKRRLGNLVLLELRPNIKLSNSDIEDKITELKSHNLQTKAKLYQVFQLQDFLESAQKHPAVSQYQRKSKNRFRDLATVICDLRESELIRFAVRAWAVPGESPNTFECIDSFRDIYRDQPYWMGNG